MNRQLLAMLIGMGIGFTAVAEARSRESAVRPRSGGELAVLPATEDGMIDVLEELIRLETVDADGDRTINDWEYIDAPTDAWYERLRLYRLA
ncbi:MAG TPA: hypothetical protein VMR74_09815 [Gammaproteobacteria bacterium]|nr:hypothetical protein [Gammaproteobacteria bacterium]